MIVPYHSFSNAICLGILAAVGVVIYAGFASLAAHSKNIEAKRRWRYSIFCGVSFGVFIFMLFGIVSVLALFGDENELGYIAVIKSPRDILDLFTGIVLLLVYPILLGLPFVFLITFGTYWQEIQRGDLFINRLLYPVKKHPSDQSLDSIIDRARTFIAKFID